MDDGKPSIDGISDTLSMFASANELFLGLTSEVMHHVVRDVNRSKREKWQKDIRSWLSPTDPSINHKIACELRHMGTMAWFIRGDTSEWKWSKPGSFLWIHGKPGAGKSILYSAIIQDINTRGEPGSCHLPIVIVTLYGLQIPREWIAFSLRLYYVWKAY